MRSLIQILDNYWCHAFSESFL